MNVVSIDSRRHINLNGNDGSAIPMSKGLNFELNFNYSDSFSQAFSSS